MGESKNTLGEILYKLRTEKNLTQEELSQITGIKRASIAQYEKGHRLEPSYEVLTTLANFFGVTIDYLLGKSPFKSLSETKYSITVAVMKMVLNDESFKNLGYDTLIWKSVMDITELLYSDKAVALVKSLYEKQTLTDVEYYQLSKFVTQTIKWPDDFNGPVTIIVQGEKISCPIDYWSIPKIRYFEHYFDEPGSEFNLTVREKSISYANYSKNRSIEFDSKYLLRIPLVGRIAAGDPILAIENPDDYIFVDIRINKINGNNFDEYFALEVIGKSMEPTIHDGEIVLVRKQPAIELGQIGVFRCNNDEATIKRFTQEGKKIYLIPDNKQFPVQEYADECVMHWSSA